MIYKELYIIIVTAVKAPSTIFCVYITLHTLLDKVIAYWQFTWQRYIDDTNERGNPGQSWVCFVFR